MKYNDVCFRLDSYYPNCRSEISTLLREFHKPATWDEEGFDSAADIIADAKDYIADLIGINCLYPIIREDSVIVMDGGELVEIYYGFIPIDQYSCEIEDIIIKERSKASLLYFDYGKTDSKEIESIVPSIVESYNYEGQNCKFKYLRFETTGIRVVLEICCDESVEEISINISKNNTVGGVSQNVRNGMIDLFLNRLKMPCEDKLYSS